MIENWLFVLGLIAVLMIPGPANALVASSAYQQGQAKTSLYIPAILMGYFYAINVWALLIHLALPIWPNFKSLLYVLSTICVGCMTLHLYKAHKLVRKCKNHPQNRPCQMFTVTLSNPKAALLASGILPMETWQSPTNFVLVFAAFCLSTVPVGIFWMVFGQAILSSHSEKIKAGLIYKGSALFVLLCLIPLLIKLWD